MFSWRQTMQEKLDLYNYKKRIEGVEKTLRNISKENKNTILRFKNHLFLKNLSKPRILKYMCFMKNLAELVESNELFTTKDLEKLIKQDIQTIVGIIQQRKYSPHTKHGYKIILKQFIRWAKGCEEGDDIPLEVKWIKGSVNRSETKLPGEGELVSRQEVEKAITGCDFLRDKAFLAILYESGCRIGEIGSLKIGNISFDKYGIQLNVFGKTGARRIRIVNATFLLRSFIESHPWKDDKNAPLWYNIEKK